MALELVQTRAFPKGIVLQTYRPDVPSRALFTHAQIEAGLDALEREHLDDGGWDFHFPHWSPGQEVEWRGIVTLHALRTLRAHGRI